MFSIHPFPTIPFVPDRADLLIAVNRAAAYGTVSRWLLHDLRNPTQALTLVLSLLNEPGPVTRSFSAPSRVPPRTSPDSLELLDRVLRNPPPGAQAGPVNVRDSLGLSRVHSPGTQIRGPDRDG